MKIISNFIIYKTPHKQIIQLTILRLCVSQTSA